MKKKIYVFLALVLALGCMFAACELDTAEHVVVKFSDPDGGNTLPDADIEKGASLGEKMPLALTREDGAFAFYGWFDGATATQYFPDTPVGASITLTARWADDNIATVSFVFKQTDDSGAVIQPSVLVSPVMVARGQPLGPLRFPVTPRAKGWSFDGWSLNGEDFTYETLVTSSIEVEAKWLAKELFTVTFDPGPGGGNSFSMQVYDGDCIDDWETRFPPDLTINTLKQEAFFVAWLDAEKREYTGRTPIRKNHLIDLTAPTDPDKHDPIKARWGLPPYIIDLRMFEDGGEIEELTTSETNDTYGNIDYVPMSKLSWDNKQVIVNNVTYDVPYNNNRWRILYRVKLKLPDDFNTGFYGKYTIRARFYANRQGAATWPSDPDYKEGQFTPDVPAAAVGYSENGWLKKKDYGVIGDDGKPKEYSRSNDGWGQISWTSVANFNGQGADAETMLQRYNLDRKGGTINDTYAPLRSPELPYPPYLLVQTSDAYIGHIEITDIVFHNGEWEHTIYLGEPRPDTGGE